MKKILASILLAHMASAEAHIVVVCPKETFKPELQVYQDEDRITVMVKGDLARKLARTPNAPILRQADFEIEMNIKDCFKQEKHILACRSSEAKIKSQLSYPYFQLDDEKLGSFEFSVIDVSYGTQVRLLMNQTNEAGNFFVNNGEKACVYEI